METNLYIKQARGNKGFSMIEMIGVLSVIGILVALIVPKIFESLANAKINATVQNYNALKTALVDHFARYGSFTMSNGVQIAVPATSTNVAGYDQWLISEGLLEKKFESKLGSGATVQIRACVGTNTPPDGSNQAYWLSGAGAGAFNETGVGVAVVECVIPNCPIMDAMILDNRIDGPDDNNLPDPTKADITGRLKYAAAGTTGFTTVYLYLAHR